VTHAVGLPPRFPSHFGRAARGKIFSAAKKNSETRWHTSGRNGALVPDSLLDFTKHGGIGHNHTSLFRRRWIMAHFSLGALLKRMASGSPSGRRQLHTANRHRCRPNLETLEGRCVPSTVTNLNDAGAGSLRQAILDAPAGGTVDFQPGLSGTIALTTGELDIVRDLTISGPGANVITVSGNNRSRVFNIGSQANVSIAELTVAGGSNSTGGGIVVGGRLTLTDSIVSGNSARGGSEPVGGGIYVGGTLALTNSTVSGNVAYPGIRYGFGGGIYSTGTVTITSSTVTDNHASGEPPSGGGGVYNSGALTVTDSTISGNTGPVGGGIDNTGTATVTEATISGNSDTFGAGGIHTFTGILNMRNTILARNTGQMPDVSGSVDSQGHDLIGDGSGGSGFTDADRVGTAANPIDPMLGPLQDNGGSTQTMALLPGSPAIDAGDNTGAPMWDQRGPGFPRIEHGIIDIGAFEYHFPRPVQLDPNPVSISETVPSSNVMARGLPGSAPTLDLAPQAAASAPLVDPETTESPIPMALASHPQDAVFEAWGDPVASGLVVNGM
jgi:hypothetical protein